jgi:lipopolysaccharide transport protein LptA
MKLVKKVIFGLFALLLVQNAHANAFDASVDVTSDVLEVEKLKGTAVFIGDVKALYKDVTLTSDRLKIVYDSSLETKNKIKVIIATGNVVLIQGTDKVTSEYAEYFVSSDEIVFKENVVLNRNGNILKGDHLTMNTVTKKAKMKSDKSKRVQAIYFQK